MRASAEPVDGNRVRLSIEVDAAEIDDAMNATVRRLGRQVRVPGFRPGKVPRQILEARLGGTAALRQQAINDLLPDWYARAVADTEVDPIAAPEIDVRGADDAGPLTVDAVVEVRPTVSVAGYGGLQVTVPSLAVADEEVDRQVDRLREHEAELVTVDRPAVDGDSVTIDLHGTRPGADDLDVDDFVYEVGSGAALPGLDEQLRGAKPGDILEFTVPSPPDAGEPDAGEAGAPAGAGDLSARVLVKDVQQKVLPELTDEWAAEASEFATVAELRADLTERLRRFKALQARMLVRDRAVEALVALVGEDPPASMVDAEVNERLHDLSHRLQERRMTLEQFLQASGRDEQGLLAELRGEATRAVQLDLALRALADAEGIEIDDDELQAAVEEMAAQVGAAPRDLRQRLEHAGRLPAVRSERRKAKALEWLEEHVELVDDEGSPVSREELQAAVEATGLQPGTGTADTGQEPPSPAPTGRAGAGEAPGAEGSARGAAGDEQPGDDTPGDEVEDHT